MRLDARAFGIAAGITSGMLFLVCAIAVTIAPGSTTSVASMLIHMDLSGMTRSITLPASAWGLPGWTLGTGLTFALAGWLYNRFARANRM